MKPCITFILLVSAALLCGCATRRTITQTAAIAAGSVTQLEVTGGKTSLETWASRLDGTFTLTIYDTTQPADTSTGLCPILAIATGSVSRRDSAMTERHDSLHVETEKHDSLMATQQTQTLTVTGAAATPVTTRITRLLWALATLVAACTCIWLFWRISRHRRP